MVPDRSYYLNSCFLYQELRRAYPDLYNNLISRPPVGLIGSGMPTMNRCQKGVSFDMLTIQAGNEQQSSRVDCRAAVLKRGDIVRYALGATVHQFLLSILLCVVYRQRPRIAA